jgi:hypothetical protein
LTLQKYKEVEMAPRIWDIQQGFVMNGVMNGRSVMNGSPNVTAGSGHFVTVTDYPDPSMLQTK